jgi:phage protein D
MTVPTPKLVVRYEGKDISAALEPYLLELTYTDYTEGESDTLELRVEDVDGRWLNNWYPNHGDRLRVSIGYEGEPLLECGTFEIDEIEMDGPPDVVAIKALGAGVKRSVRTHEGRHYENTTLAKVAADIAKRNALVLHNNDKKKFEKMPIAYVAQAFETDLGFLKRLFEEYGYGYRQRDKDLYVYALTEIKAKTPVMTLGRKNLISWRFRDKVHLIYSEVKSDYYDPRHKAVESAKAKDAKSKVAKRGKDTLRMNVRAESPEQAQAKAQAALTRANDEQTGLTLELEGEQRLMAGLSIRLTEFGRMNGKYCMNSATHRFSRADGYKTTVEAKRVRELEFGADGENP